MVRYIITERVGQYSEATDPLAQVVKRHTGKYDLLDTKHGDRYQEKVVLASGQNLQALRDIQAKLNTSGMFD